MPIGSHERRHGRQQRGGVLLHAAHQPLTEPAIMPPPCKTCAGQSIFEANRCDASVHGGFVFIGIQHAYRQPRAALRAAAKGRCVLACGASAFDGASHHAADHA